jgi:hypothetical protein
MRPEYAIYNAIILGLFAALLVLIVSRILLRVWRFRHKRQDVPTLLWRDLITMGCLAAPFGLIFLFRVMGITPLDQWGLAWILFLGIVGNAGLAVFAYFEFFVIDDRIPVLKEPETQDQREDREFGDKRRDLEAKHAETLAKSENDQPPQ